MAERRPDGVTARTWKLYRQACALDLPDLLEDQWQAYVEVRAHLWAWGLQFHVRRAQVKGAWVTNTSSPGVPDLWLVRGPRLVVIECKSEAGSASTEQLAWIAALDAVPGIDALVAAPRDWPRVQQLLSPDNPGTLTPVHTTKEHPHE